MVATVVRPSSSASGATSWASSFLVGLLCLVFGGCTTSSSEHPARPTLAIVGGVIVDPDSELPPAIRTVLISGGQITAIVPGVQRPAGLRTLEAHGRYIVPGLWDMHAHLATGDTAAGAPENYVAHGVLGVRDMGGHLEALQRLRAEVNEGRIAPTMVIAGPTLNGEASASFHRAIRDEAEARAAVRELAAAGVDFIKIHRRTGAEAFRAIADETRRLGIGFVGHVPLSMRWPEAAAAGMRSIEHIQTLLENETIEAANPVESAFRTLERVEGPRGREIFAALARHRTYFTPTLIFFERTWQRDTPERRAIRQRLYARLQPQVRRAAASGVPILAGTDLFDSHGVALLDELERLVDAGLSPRQALAAATANARRLSGRGPGRIAPGEEASLLIVDADPTADIRNLRRLTAVVLRGRVIEGAELATLRR